MNAAVATPSKGLSATDYFILTRQREETCELIEGVIHVHAFASMPHQRILLELSGQVRDFLRGKKQWIAALEVESEVESSLIVRPDLMVASAKRYSKIHYKGRIRGGLPEILVEIVSPGHINRKRDMVTKRKLYLEHGVQEYWVVDPEKRNLTVFSADGTEIHQETGLWKGSHVLEGFELDLTAIWELIEE